ncbi:Hypothetical predicted protein [Lecanosticta acicola]|uniref:Uncharacterized protein n=1 Tax=Lecanosticta acicola TaxID=111012 RepID=A0AAI8YUB8_9PEZI|nr:Hypothetical predicted protein [Lecanosticta acicola]
MATTTYLKIEQPSNDVFKIKEVSDPKDANATSSILPGGSGRFDTFGSATRQTFGEGFLDFDWNAGPIEIKGIISTSTKGVGLELTFNEGDAGTRLIGVFWGNLDTGLQVEYTGGSSNARIYISLREGKYVWVDATRDRWAKKRVILTLA